MAGRVDKEEMKIGSRYVSNFIPEHQGGLKKFYGSGHVGKVTESLTTGYRMIPFDGCGEPLCLLFVPDKVYCVTRSEMYPVPISISLQMILGSSYVQSSDVMYITNEDMGQAVITYSGRDEETGHHMFYSSAQHFVVEPFFPLNWQGNYNGLPLTINHSAGHVTITGQQTATVFSIELPDVLKNVGTGKNVTSEDNSTLAITSKYSSNSTGAVIGGFTIALHRIRNGADSVVQTANIGAELETASSSVTILTGGA